MHYKAKKPEETVNKLINTLHGMGVNVKEEWQAESSIGTYALRLNFEGTNIGTNGKGVTKNFARASAYAEFFERYQNDILGPRINFKQKFPFYISPDEKLLSSEEIVSDDNSFINQYFCLRKMDKCSTKKKATAFYDVQKIDYHVYQLDDQYICLPFYSVREGKIKYLPKSTYTPFYGSNGMCAGNTPEEAIVQGLSEIIERVVQKKIFMEKPCLPDVPDDYIKNFPYVYSILQKLRNYEKDGFKFYIKDCSFGGKYPVAALIVFEKNTGKFGIKLGCHPDYGVAIERTLTEATQGQDITEYASRSKVDFTNFHVDDWKNIYNSYKFGMGQYPYQLFDESPTFEFKPVMDVSNLNNKQIMKIWLKQIIDSGYDIYIRDVSVLDFPSYHIIIPGLSEMIYPDDTKFRATNTRYYISNMLRDYPEKITKQNNNYFIATMEYFSGNAFENTMQSYYGIINPKDIPCENIHGGCAYFISMCYAMNKDYDNAEKGMSYVILLADNAIKKGIIERKYYDYLLGIKYYLGAMKQFKNHQEAMRYIRLLFSNEVSEKINNVFYDSSKIITKQYPGMEKYGTTNEKKYANLYESILRYTVALRKKQMENNVSQELISTILN
ncbi:MAG: YcaO-like family protein [Catonella sp.]|nr:YcaO-like family protein [Catonella sp.]MDY6357838.1 YcaO-like family protein [Catonella sp.]